VQHGISANAPTLSYVIGFPEEESEDVDQTLLLALRTGILGIFQGEIQVAIACHEVK